MCPICGKQDLLKLSEHLRQVHQLSCNERKSYLKNAVFSSGFSSPEMMQNRCMETKPYPSFQFKHPAMMMIVGPTLLNSKSIKYPSRKARRIHLFYTQWQPLYDRLRATHGSSISFTQGLPEVKDNLENIDDKVHNLWVLDDLMEEAVQSPIISQLFTRGGHRNLSVILLLQNMFPKGKFNTNISRNALYKVLFRSPGDRKQIDILAEQTFGKHRPNFMKAYTKETEKPFGYIILDNHPRTTSDKQVVADVFGDCYAYPHITKSPSPDASLPQSIATPDGIEQPKPSVKRKVELHVPPAKKQKKPTVKRKAESDNKPAKKSKKQSKTKQTTKKDKKLPQKQTKPQARKPRKQAVYKPKFIKSPPRESFTEEEQFYSEEEQFSPEEEEEFYSEGEEEPRHLTQYELNAFARPRTGFGPIHINPQKHIHLCVASWLLSIVGCCFLDLAEYFQTC